MSVIIRLQGLPWSASALDIRQFFKGLTIPAGGVHIIGGDRGDAFIAFSSDEDARQGMMRNMATISGTPVQLFLSSKSEMQTVIEEARAAESPAVAVVGSGGGVPAMQQPLGMQQGGMQQGAMQQHAGMQQGAMQPGMNQGFQGQQGYPGAQGMGNQRFPSQAEPQQTGRGMNQGQFSGNQNLMGQGYNQMQGSMQSQQMPGQQGRDNQYSMQQNQPMNQPNLYEGQQQSGMNNQYGLSADSNLPTNSNSRGQQNQPDASNVGYGMEGGYGGNNFNQWQNSGQMQGQGQPYGSNQHFFNRDDTSQGSFSGSQSGQRPDQFGNSMSGLEGQQFPGQTGETKPDRFGFNQQGGFGQEGMPPGGGNHFQMRGGRPGSQEMNRGGLLPHPGMPGQSDEKALGRLPDPSGQIPPRPGPGSRGTPDDPMRSAVTGRPQSKPFLDQLPGMPKGTEPGRLGMHGDEVFLPEGREGFPTGRGSGFPPRPGMQQEDVPGMPRGRGMLPTPDMPPQGKQPGFGSEQFGDMDTVEQGQWPGYGGDDFMNRRERGMEPGRDMRRDPDLRRPEQEHTRGQFHEGGDSDFRGSQHGSQDPFEAPGVVGRPGFDASRDRRSMEIGPDGRPLDRGVDRRSLDRVPDGRPLDRGFDRGLLDRGPDGRTMDMGPNGRPMDFGPDGRPLPRDPDGRPLDRGPDGRLLERGPGGRPLQRSHDGRPLLERGPDGRPLDVGPDVGQFERGLDGRPLERGPDGRPLPRGHGCRPLLERGPDGRPSDVGSDTGHFERAPDGRPIERGPDGRHIERGPDRRPGFERGPDGRPGFERGPDGRPGFERGPDERSFERGPDARPFERGPDGRPLERGPDGRSFERGPDARPFERGPDGRPLERGPDGRPFERGPDGGPFERGPDGRPFEKGVDRRSLDRGADGRPYERGLDRRSLERGPDGRPLDRGPDGRPFGRDPGGRPFGRDADGRPFDRGQDDREAERRPIFAGPEGPFDSERGRERRNRFDAPPDHRFPPHEEYDPMQMDYDPAHGGQNERRLPSLLDFDPENKGFGNRGGRGGMEGARGRGGFERGRGRGFGGEFPPHGHPDYPMEEGYNDQQFEEEMPGFGEEFGNQFPGSDFDSRIDAGRGRGNPDRGRGGRMEGPGGPGRLDGPHGRMERGHGHFDTGLGHDLDTDRRQGGFQGEDMDIRGLDIPWGIEPDEVRPAGKGLLGDAPVGLLPAPGSKKEEDKDSRPSHSRDYDRDRDRDRRGHSDRRDRDDRGDRVRDDRRRSDRRRSRDRSSDRDRHSRRNDRDRDRSDRRDRERSRDKDRSSSNRDRESRSKDVTTKEPSNGRKENEKDVAKNDKKTEEEKKPSTDSSQPPPSKFVYAKGFPLSYNFKEVRRFCFGSELPFDGIKIINDIKGQRTGEAYLKFMSEEAAKRAMKKSGETIFGNPVTLMYTTAKIFESQVDSQPAPNSELGKAPNSELGKTPTVTPPVVMKDQEKTSLTIMIKGLPFSVKREDLKQFFSNVKLADNGEAISLEYDSRNQITGVAYIEAASLQDFKTAMGFDGRVFQSRPMKLSGARREDMELCIKKQQEMLKRQANRTGEQPGQQPQQQQPQPQQQKQQQPQQPNLGAGLMGPRPPLMGQAPGRPGPQPLLNITLPNIPMPLIPPRNGPAFDPNLALQQRQQLLQQQQQQQQQQEEEEKSSMDQGPSHCVHVQGLPMLASYKDIREFFGDLQIATQRGIQIVHDGVGKPMGEGFVEFATDEDKEKALKKDKTSMGRHILAVKSVAKPDMIERLRNARLVGLPPGQGPLPGPPNFMPRNPDPAGGMRPIPPGVLNRNWFYLSCQNFPPAVSITEIMGFFQVHNPLPDSIRLHYAADGSPTGNAVVGFARMEDASRAMNELNGKPCRRSIVTLSPAL
ncbi:collagen, type I, alpha 1a-like isoform X2 [Littorina saxatilis]|uniref:RRM domain-containing protein n=2 Tax=Littorina saxatilis TaxID=31220 RepID=A0AAN9GMY0_9CAEN